MRLLIDSLPASSLGIIQLRDELSPAVKRQRPEGCEAILIKTINSSPLVASEDFRIIEMPELMGGWIGKWRWYHVTLPSLAKTHKADVVYSMSGILSDNLRRSFATITSVNNMVPFNKELRKSYRWYSRERARNELLQRTYVRSLRLADAVILHSRHGLETVKKYAGDISPKTIVVLTGVPSDIGFDRGNPPSHPYRGRPYFFYYSKIIPYKNHLNLIHAYARVGRDVGPTPDLLIAGQPADQAYLKKIRTCIAQSGLADRVKYIGFIRREDVAAWIHHAELNFFASTCETNPVTLAEILALGGVLACSNMPPMTEVAGSAAEYFDPHDIESMTNAIRKLMSDNRRRQELRSLAFRRADELSWSACGKAIWEAAEKAQVAYRHRKNSGSERRPTFQ